MRLWPLQLAHDPAMLSSQCPGAPGLCRALRAMSRHCPYRRCSVGAPNLGNSVWLYGDGGIGDIEYTILYGIRSGHPKAHNVTDMPAEGRPAVEQREKADGGGEHLLDRYVLLSHQADRQAGFARLTSQTHSASDRREDSSILLVDDDSRTLELLQETLRSAGYETQSVQSGARALEVLASKFVGAVVLDLHDAGMDGFEVIRHIRHQPALKRLPVFVMTARNLAPEELALLNTGRKLLIQKNGSWHQQLLVEIGQAIRGRALAHAARQS